jgi:hypothetical protein
VFSELHEKSGNIFPQDFIGRKKKPELFSAAAAVC